ncbi:MAG TPA: helix-turn-helix domain-containing protein, partial [Bacillota bacterium]
VPDDVVYYIAERVTSNIRELEGALIRLIAHSSLTGQPITLETARASLRDLLPDPPRVNITIARIQEVVAEHFGLRVEDLKLRKRTRAVAFPRQIAMFLCRDLTDASLPRIGEEFGGRDHTTVLHACEKIARERDRDATLRQILHQLTQRLRQEQSRP